MLFSTFVSIQKGPIKDKKGQILEIDKALYPPHMWLTQWLALTTNLY